MQTARCCRRRTHRRSIAQASDNLAFLVEEHDVSRRLARYERLDRDLSDLFNDSVADRSSFYHHTGREYIFGARYSY